MFVVNLAFGYSARNAFTWGLDFTRESIPKDWLVQPAAIIAIKNTETQSNASLLENINIVYFTLYK